MSSDTEVTSDMAFNLFKEKSAKLLEQSFFAYLTLSIISFTIYLAILPRNVQNILPVLLTVFLGAFTWIVRAKILQEPPNQIRIYLMQWIILTVVVVLGTLFAIVVYPYSNAF